MKKLFILFLTAWLFPAVVRAQSPLKKVYDENVNPMEQIDKALAAAMMQRLGSPARFGFPVFIVLNGEGKVIHTQDSSFLEEGDGYSKDKVLRFFKNWTPSALARITARGE